MTYTPTFTADDVMDALVPLLYPEGPDLDPMTAFLDEHVVAPADADCFLRFLSIVLVGMVRKLVPPGATAERAVLIGAKGEEGVDGPEARAAQILAAQWNGDEDLVDALVVGTVKASFEYLLSVVSSLLVQFRTIGLDVIAAGKEVRS